MLCCFCTTKSKIQTYLGIKLKYRKVVSPCQTTNNYKTLLKLPLWLTKMSSDEMVTVTQNNEISEIVIQDYF